MLSTPGLTPSRVRELQPEVLRKAALVCRVRLSCWALVQVLPKNGWRQSYGQETEMGGQTVKKRKAVWLRKMVDARSSSLPKTHKGTQVGKDCSWGV